MTRTTAHYPADLIETVRFLSDECGCSITEPTAETESAEYSAFTFKLNGLFVRYRSAKITPTKTGQFVTLWKRIGKGPIQPFDISDTVDLFIISVRTTERFGLFLFPSTTLHEKKILSDAAREGKRAIRVYPAWDSTTNKQAQKTQQWQSEYFFEILQGNKTDRARAKQLIPEKSQLDRQ